ncbi:hypothetical protein A2U01_0040490, partial [Trifolium medium]|nr:hypothetical protein [Trifolium medium]
MDLNKYVLINSQSGGNTNAEVKNGGGDEDMHFSSTEPTNDKLIGVHGVTTTEPMIPAGSAKQVTLSDIMIAIK